jgi:hypothetical protein
MQLKIVTINSVVTSYLARYPYFKDALTLFQLYDLGIGGSGQKLKTKSKRTGRYGIYSATYEPYKLYLGGKVTTFNLKLTGKLYQSYKFEIKKKEIITYADTIKGDANLLTLYPDAFQPAKITLNTIIKGNNERVKVGLIEHSIKTILKNFKTNK